MKVFAVLSLLFAVAQAAPLDAINVDSRNVTPWLEKRDTEVIYLANCQSAVSCCTPNVLTSKVIYYGKSADSQNQPENVDPPTDNQCLISGNGFLVWEGADRSCKFPSGVTWTSHINSGAGSGPWDGKSYAGSGNNGKNWNCYHDVPNRRLYTNSGPEWAYWCDSIYYCLPA